MDSDKIFGIKQWFKKADNDLRSIENNLKDEDPPLDIICFHAQQAIEKYLKGAMSYFGKHVTKTHDLIFLLNTIAKDIPELKEFEEELRETSHYGVEVRYPDIFYEPSLEEAQKAYELALKVKEIVLEKIKV